LACSFGVVLHKPGTHTPTKFFYFVHRVRDPVSYSELKDILNSVCHAAHFHPGIGAREEYIILMKQHRSGQASKMDTVGFFKCQFSIRTGIAIVRQLQMASIYKRIREEYYLVDKGIKYAEPKLMEIDPERWDPLKSALHHDTLVTFRPTENSLFGINQYQFGTFEGSFHGLEFSSNPHHEKKMEKRGSARTTEFTG